MVSSDFDLQKYLRVSDRLDITDVDWSEVRRHPLSDADIRVLTYMMDTEYNTIMYLRELLQTTCAFDPQVTAFMSCWAFEELWHGEFISRFLQEYGVRDVSQRTGELRKEIGGQLLKRLKFGAASKVIPDFVAIPMTWGALNELTACHAYQRLAELSGHPVLNLVMPRIVKQERRHFAFYFAQAKLRMERRPYLPWMVRQVIDRVWQPVGSGLKHDQEVDFVMLYLFDNPEGREAVKALDGQFCALPGMEGANPLGRALERSRSRYRGERPERTLVPPLELQTLATAV